MSVKPPVSAHPVAYIHTLDPEGQNRRDGFVFCSRRAESVSLSSCAHCPRFVKVQSSTQGDVLHCVSGPASNGHDALTPLSLPRLPVSAVMTRNVICVRPDLTLDAATELFIESGLKAAPVVDHEGKLIGFVSEAEVMLEVQTGSSSRTRPTTVGDVMMPYALTLPETASITRAAAVMAFEGQQRLAIVSQNGAVIGVLSSSDILYWLARADGHILPRPRPR